MADEINNAPVDPVQQIQQVKQDTPTVESPPKEDWKNLVDGKFTTEHDLAKAYKELEKKLGEQGEKIRQTEEFATVINPLLEEIRNDPVIFDQLDKRLKEKGNPNNTPTESSTKDKQVDEARLAVSDLYIKRFEEKYGIDKLPPEESAALRNSIGAAVARMTGKSYSQVDLRQLESVLEDAYLIANKDKLINKEALADATGGIPSIPTSPSKSETTLSQEEATVADRLGLTREQYLSGKKSK